MEALPNFANKKSHKESRSKLYKPIKRLGAGANGEVFEVERTTDKIHFAYKKIKVQDIDEKTAKAVKEEGKILKRLNHPCIIRLVDFFLVKDKKEFCIITELCKNGDLTDVIKKHKMKGIKIPEDNIIDWLTQICFALTHIHNKRIIHRDLKPNNLFLSSHNVIKIGDFGASKSLLFKNQLAGTVVGTPLYMSPEVVDAKEYNNKVDMWSLGVILYELITLKNPFEANSMPASFNKILQSKYPPLPESTNKELKDLVYSLIQVDPNKRPSASEVLETNIIKERANKRLKEVEYNEELSQSCVLLYVKYF
ncbi:MAG: serine/threonine-protein kinase Nek [archaeon]|nr:serine/threonine-protein kinase Nek [archaeon]